MSESLDVKLEYEVPFSTSNVKRVLQVLESAVDDSWRRYHDPWCAPEPEARIDVGQILRECEPANLRPSADGTSLRTDFHWFAFSPLSSRACTLCIFRTGEGQLAVYLSVPGTARYEHRGEREQGRMEYPWYKIREQRGEDTSGKRGPDRGHPDYDAWWERWDYFEELDEPTRDVWPENKQCLLHVIARLRSVFPGRIVHIDEELQSGEAAGGRGQAGDGPRT